MQVSLPRLSTSFFCFVLRILLFLFTQLFAPANHLVPYLLVCILLIVFFPSSNLISFFLLHLFLLLIFSSSISSYFFFLFCSFSCFVALLFPSFVSQSSFILSFLFFFLSLSLLLLSLAGGIRRHHCGHLTFKNFLKTFNLLTVFALVYLTNQSLLYIKNIQTATDV